MSHLKQQTVNEGYGLAEYDYLPFSEFRIVKQLIANRSKIDNAYGMKLYETDNPVVSNGVPVFQEPIICTYIDLDRLIDTCGQSKSQERVIKWVMEGYSVTDIADHINRPKQTIVIHINRGVEKIVKKNNEDWKRWTAGKYGCGGNNGED